MTASERAWIPWLVALVLTGCGAGSAARLETCSGSPDDGDPCTADACDPATGAITHTPSAELCPASAACSPAVGCQAAPQCASLCPAGQVCTASGCQESPQCAALPRVAGTTVRLQQVAADLVEPVYVSAPPGEASRLFVVEQAGRVRLVKDGQLLPAPYLDLAVRVASGGERGLLSIAFHPSFAANGKLYVNYTDATGDVHVSELTASDPAGDAADPASEVNLLTVSHHAFANHNGGMLTFGPDGYLYASVGDGGGEGDPLGSGQDRSSLLGKLLRIDVTRPAAVVPGNPFGNAVYDHGLRNPWRFSFDRLTGDLYIGDVGQDLWEEIDFKASPGPGQAPPPGTNWGWNLMEGDGHCYPPGTSFDCNAPALAIARPILEYSHAEGVTVIGGYVYRGVSLPDLAATGTYFYADSGSGFVRTFRAAGGAATAPGDLTAALGSASIVSFGEDGCGELYLVDHGGTVSKVVPGP